MSTLFQQFRLNSIITVSCIRYEVNYSLGYICIYSPQFLFKRKTCRCFSNELCSSFIIFKFNDDTLIMHTNTLYFSYMKCTMANAQSSKFEFSGKRQREFLSFTCWIQVFCPEKIQSTDLLQNNL